MTTDLTFGYPGFGEQAVDYQVGWQEQRRLHEQRVAGAGHDIVLMLEHTSVYTAGRRTEPQDLPVDGTPVIDVDRGGKITWHGPGQLVVDVVGSEPEADDLHPSRLRRRKYPP